MESNFNLKNKISFITGSTRGIGWAIAKLFAQNGATILLNGTSNQNLLDERVNFIKNNYNVPCEGFLFDVCDYDKVKNCYNKIFKNYKRLDILVNNAGILDDSLIGMIGKDNIDKTLNINVKGVLYNLQLASRLMGRNKYGSIINMSSIIGRFGNEGQVVYAGSKSAIIGITLSSAKELASQNIRVNAIAPGFIETDMIKNIPSEKFKQRLDSIKMKRIGKPEDVANAVLFFASDLSEYITGQVLGVDGGMLI